MNKDKKFWNANQVFVVLIFIFVIFFHLFSLFHYFRLKINKKSVSVHSGLKQLFQTAKTYLLKNVL